MYAIFHQRDYRSCRDNGNYKRLAYLVCRLKKHSKEQKVKYGIDNQAKSEVCHIRLNANRIAVRERPQADD